jgi:hypothetical protein
VQEYALASALTMALTAALVYATGTTQLVLAFVGALPWIGAGVRARAEEYPEFVFPIVVYGLNQLWEPLRIAMVVYRVASRLRRRRAREAAAETELASPGPALGAAASKEPGGSSWVQAAWARAARWRWRWPSPRYSAFSDDDAWDGPPSGDSGSREGEGDEGEGLGVGTEADPWDEWGHRLSMAGHLQGAQDRQGAISATDSALEAAGREGPLPAAGQVSGSVLDAEVRLDVTAHNTPAVSPLASTAKAGPEMTWGVPVPIEESKECGCGEPECDQCGDVDDGLERYFSTEV